MKIFLIFFFLFSTNLFGEYIVHQEIDEAPNNLPCQIEAFVNIGIENIHRFSLLYRPKGSTEFIETNMNLIGYQKYIGAIPRNFMIGEYVEYYLLLELLYQTHFFDILDDLMEADSTLAAKSQSLHDRIKSSPVSARTINS